MQLQMQRIILLVKNIYLTSKFQHKLGICYFSINVRSRFDNEKARRFMHRLRLNCFFSEAGERNGISTIWETDNEQNKRSEEKQKAQPFPCVGFVEKGSRRCCCPARKMEGEFSPVRPLSPKLLFSLSVPFVCAYVRLFLRRRYRKGGKARRRVAKYGEKLREGTTTTMDTQWGYLRVGAKRINTFALKLPRVQGREIMVHILSYLFALFNPFLVYFWNFLEFTF